MYGLLFYLWFRTAKGPLERLVTLIVFGVWVGMVSMARLALGAHWPSDIVAGVAVGLMTLMMAIAALEWGERTARQRKSAASLSIDELSI